MLTVATAYLSLQRSAEPPVRKWTTNEYAWHVKLENYYQENVSLKEHFLSVPLAASLHKASSSYQRVQLLPHTWGHKTHSFFYISFSYTSS